MPKVFLKKRPGVTNKLPPVFGTRRLAPCLALLICLAVLFSLPLPALALDLPLCFSGRRIVIPGPENSQVARIFEHLAPLVAGEGAPPTLLFHPGRGGGYALRDLGAEKTDGCAMAGLMTPSFFYQLAAPNSLVQREEISVCVISAQSPNALWVAEDSPFTSWEQFHAHARAAADDPVSQLLIAGSGSFTDQHMATFQLNRAAGIKVGYSPVLGSEQAAKAVQAGKALACWGYALDAGSMPGMRPLAVAATQRSVALPETPTFKELGVNCVNSALFSFAVSAAVPEKRRQALRESFKKGKPGHIRSLPGLMDHDIKIGDVDIFMNILQEQAKSALDDYPMLGPALR